MESIEIQEPGTAAATAAKTPPPKKNGFVHRRKRLLVTVIVAFLLAVVIAIVVAVVVTGNNKRAEEKRRRTTVPASTSTSIASTTTTIDRPDSRMDCLPWLKNKPNASLVIQSECSKQVDCKYQPSSDENAPACYYDTDSLKLSVLEINETDLGRSYIVIPKSKKQTTDAIKVNFEYLEDHVLRIEITKPTQQEYHVPIHPNRPVDKIKAKNPLYEVVVNENESEFSFQIKRISTQTIIWDTSIGAIIYENLNRQIATKLPSTNVYGFGENKHESFRHDFNYKNWPIFNRDEAPENVPQGNLYGTQPFYTCLEPYGKSHGVALVNSNAMEYEFVPNPGLIYRTTGGVFDFYVFLGPEPENVVQQFTQYFGRPFLPPYWALGFSISRYGYKNLEDMKGVLTRFENNNLPLDVQVADIDHFDKRADFTIDQENWAGLPDYFNELHEKGMKTVLILDPAIPIERGETYWPYENGVTNDVFIKWDNGTTMFAACWPPGPVAYPDFFKKSTQEWWINSILQHHQTLNFDGIWIDMNDPSAFGTNELKPFNWPEDREPWSLKCPDDEYELVKTKASYVHKDDNKLSDKTLCMSGLQGENNEYKHFDVHNLFGHVQLQPTYEAAKKIQNDENNKRGLVYSRSTFLGSGQYGGHWTGDNHSRWSNLYYSIIGMLEFNLFGIPYVGADICGFFEDTTVELCARWSSLGAFYPFSRNHNGENNIDQDPGALGEEVVRAAKNALEIRYEILPYYYTLFYKSHVHGNTVARPLFHEFSRDSRTYSIDRQFLIGPAFLVTPVLEENVTSVEGYFPQSHWYDYYTGRLIVKQDDNGKFVELDSPLDHIPLHIRGGYILPTQNHGLTTTASRQNPFGLIVAPDNYGEAKGDLFYDDGETDVSLGQFFYATFNLRENILKMYVEKNDYSEMENKVLDKIRIFVAKPSSKLTFILNKDEIISDDKITYGDNEIVLNDLNIPMSKSFEIEWTSEYYLTGGSLGPIIDCSPDNGSINETECTDKGCMYYAAIPFDYIPRCFVQESKGGYMVQATNGNEIELVRGDTTLNIVKEGAIENVRLTISHGSIADKFGLTRIKFDDRDKSRYQVPVQLNYAETQTSFLNVDVANSGASNRAQISVKNSDRSKTLFDNVEVEHGLAFYDQFLQIVLNLRDYKNLYGMGENTHYSFKHRFAYSSWWGVFGRDQPPGGRYINLYGSHPFFMAVDETTGRAFGALILNSNAQEYGLLPPSSISYRSVGGILDIYVMEEATPELLIQAYTTLIGKPFMPPYWALGFQLSRYGYNIIERLQDAVNRTLNAKIPLDVQYADIDHFHRQLDFTYDIDKFRGLPDYIQELRQKGVRFIIILDPAINSEATDYAPFKNGIEADAYIKWPEDENPQLNEFGDNNNPYLLGYVWPEGKTVFPDFFRESAKNWWINEIKEYYHNTLKFDGLWIDMNEPANFGTNEEKPWNWPAERPPWSLKCPNNNYDDPPYLPLVARPYGNRARISEKTICMRARQGESDQEYTHYDVHNMFGWSQSEPTQRALRELLNERSVVISRSTYVSSGTHAGHWLGDNNSSWDHLKFNIIGLLEFNLFGIPYIGADICGYFSDTTPEMCTRWMQLGAFNTFFRNHNGMGYIDQDPAALGVDVAASSRSAVELRYTLLPFLYTLFYNAHLNGGTVIRSLMHEFPQDVRALDIDRQFMWGSSLLISPVLDPNTRSVFAYFPKEARWFDYYTGVEIESGRAHEIDAPLDFIPLHVRGGSIIVTQDSAMNTDLSRTNPFRLLIAPGQENTEYKFELFYDNGVNLDLEQASHIEFSYIFDGTSHKINISPGPVFNYEFHANNTLNEIRIFGVKNAPNSMVLDGNGEISTFEFRSDTKVLTIYNLGIKFEKDNSYSLTVN